jgi:hypothetical protein
MRLTIKILACIGISAVINYGSFCLSSTYLHDYIKSNLIGLLVTLFAISIAQISILLPQITKIKEQYAIDLSRTVSSIKVAIIELMSIVGIAVVTLILANSVIADKSVCVDLCFDTILTASFIYAIYILWDIFKAITKISNL